MNQLVNYVPEVTAGNIFAVISFVAVLIMQWGNMRSDLKNVTIRLDALDREMQEQTKILIKLSVQEEKVTQLEKRIEECMTRIDRETIILHQVSRAQRQDFKNREREIDGP